MTGKEAVKIINEAYGYEIIDGQTADGLLQMQDSVISEFGIDTLYEFLSYDINEFSDMRKTVHVRRFFQFFKKPMLLSNFDMEAFHKIQAACALITSSSGNMRGYGAYDYSGFVKVIFDNMGYSGKNEGTGSSIRQKMTAIEKYFTDIGKISLGAYSMDIFIGYNLALKRLSKASSASVINLFMDILEDVQDGKKPIKKVKKLIAIGAVKPEKAAKAIDDYIEYAVSGFGGYVQDSENSGHETDINSWRNVKNDARDYFARYLDDSARVSELSEYLEGKMVTFENNWDNPDVVFLFLALVRELTKLHERLSFYEDGVFIRSLNNIFINKAKELMNLGTLKEIKEVRNRCIEVIEDNITGFTVFELDRVMAGLSGEKPIFDEMYGIDPDESEAAIDEIDDFLKTSLEVLGSIRDDLREDVRGMFKIDEMSEAEQNAVTGMVYNFEYLLKFLAEEEQQ
jgi:hypothetical protein